MEANNIYIELLSELKLKIQQTQQRTISSVNTEMIFP